MKSISHCVLSKEAPAYHSRATCSRLGIGLLQSCIAVSGTLHFLQRFRLRTVLLGWACSGSIGSQLGGSETEDYALFFGIKRWIYLILMKNHLLACSESSYMAEKARKVWEKAGDECARRYMRISGKNSSRKRWKIKNGLLIWNLVVTRWIGSVLEALNRGWFFSSVEFGQTTKEVAGMPSPRRAWSG